LVEVSLANNYWRFPTAVAPPSEWYATASGFVLFHALSSLGNTAKARPKGGIWAFMIRKKW